MIDTQVIEDLERFIPSGERSDFINEVLEEKLIKFGRQKASELIDEFRRKHPMKMTNKQILKIIHDGRRC